MVINTNQHDNIFLNDKNYADDNNYGLRVYFNDDPDGDDKTLQRSEAESWLKNIDNSCNITDYDNFLDTMFNSGKEYTTGASFIIEAEKLINPTKNPQSYTLDQTELSQLKQFGKKNIPKNEMPSAPHYEGINNEGIYVPKPENAVNWDNNWKRWNEKDMVYAAVMPPADYIKPGYQDTINLIESGQFDPNANKPKLPDDAFWAGDTANLPEVRDGMFAPRDVNKIINGETALADIKSYARLGDTINALRFTLKTQVKNGTMDEDTAFDIYYNKISDLRNSDNQFSQIPVKNWIDTKRK
jgi:hypothetical protein